MRHDVCLGEMYEQWASLVVAARKNGGVRRLNGSLIVQKDDDETNASIDVDEDDCDEVGRYSLAACQEEIFCSSDYTLSETTNGTAARWLRTRTESMKEMTGRLLEAVYRL